MLRATNTGITALIDHNGAVVDNLKPFERNHLTIEVQGTSGQTPYNFFGNYLILLFSSFILFFFVQKRIF